MKKIIGMLVLATSLAACGITQEIDVSGTDKNSLGLKGKPITVSLLKNDLRVQAKTGEYTTTSDPFADPSNITQYVNNIKGWAFKQGFAGTATVRVDENTPATGCPSTLTLSNVSATIKIISGTQNKLFTLTPSTTTLAMTEGSTDCQYTFNVATLLFSVNISGADLATLVTLLTDGAQNTAEATLKLTANELDVNRELVLNWGDTTATLTVGL
jgi:hypothetical protein